MDVPLLRRLVKLMREKADSIEAGNSHLSESEAMHIMEVICHEEMSKTQVCKYLNMCRAKFEQLVRTKQMPEGRKVTGFSELRWYKDEIDECVRKIKERHVK